MPDKRNEPITIGDTTVASGRKRRLELPFAKIPTGSEASLPVQVINGRTAGPHIWISGAVHGDELNGVEIVRRVMKQLDAKTLRGAVIAVPIVNPLGFLSASRYLPDRRDLNRSFPGSPRGSTASRLAHLFMTEIVSKCSVGIDLHTASDHRVNIPQIRADIYNEETRSLARAFGAPFTIHARVRRGSLRHEATKKGIHVLLYEAGQAQRFDEDVIKFGVDGVMRTFRKLGMIEARLPRPPATKEIHYTRWVRARRGGLASILVDLGERVEKGDKIATISDAFATRPAAIRTPTAGWVIARTENPLVNPGDALVHVASEEGPDSDEPAVRGR